MPYPHAAKDSLRCDYCGRAIRKGAKYVYPTPPSLLKHGEAARRYHLACYDEVADPYKVRRASY